jgi:hypothetical protein
MNVGHEKTLKHCVNVDDRKPAERVRRSRETNGLTVFDKKVTAWSTD